MSNGRDFDSPWKETLELFLEPVLQLLFPDIHAGIDWSKGYESLDTELRAIVSDAELGATLADKLFRVSLRDGTDVWVLVHLEVQSQPDPDFARRMFVYHYRILDRYNRDVVSLAILGDERENWRPAEYVRGRFGCEVRFRFRNVKLLDWSARTDELAASPNPVAPIVLAHLQSLATNQDPAERLRAKWQLIRGLYHRGLNAEGVRQLYRLIDWLLDLPAELEQQLRHDLHEYQEELRMPYVTSIERLAREEGREEGRQEGFVEALSIALELKFGEAGLAFARELQNVKDLAKLRAIQQAIRSAKSVDELRSALLAPGRLDGNGDEQAVGE